MKKTLFSLLIVAVAALFIHGCAAKEEKAAHGDVSGKTITIATGDFFEACDKWTPGDKVNFTFTSSKPVMFDVHYHEKHAKAYAIEQTLVDKFEGSFIVKSEDIHCCMWKNDNDKFVTLTYDMTVEKQ
jgi:hypothetical protein